MELRGLHAYHPSVIEYPWDFDAELIQRAPVCYDCVNDVFLVSGYQLTRDILRDANRFSSRYLEKMLSKEPFPAEVMEIYATGFPIIDALLVTDGERHQRHRRIITCAFSRKRLETLAPLFQRRIDVLLDKVLHTGRLLFRADLADAVPLVMTEEQLRIPTTDMPLAFEWSKILSSGFGGIPKPLERLKYEAHQIVALQRYFAGRIANEMQRIRDTGQGERDDDLLTLLATAVLDPNDPMDMTEALSFILNLFPATHDSTTAALTACMHRLVENRDAQERAANEPDFLLKFVEEAMRHESPVRAFWRRAVSDIELAGVSIPAGSWLLLRISAANRDETIYENAGRFDPDRSTPKPHLSFSSGIHTCAGRMYARHIIVATLRSLLHRARDFRFVDGANDFAHGSNMLLASYRELAIEFTVRRR